MRKYFIILFIFVCGLVNAQTDTDNRFIKSIVKLIIESRITVYDTLLNAIPTDSLRYYLYKNDTVINCQWTRPKFIDNIYHDSFDGVAIFSTPIIDTVSYVNNSDYVAFKEYDYDDDGIFLDIKILFLLKRNSVPLTPTQIKNKTLQNIPIENRENTINNLIITNNKNYWTNSEISIGNDTYPISKCEKKYRIKLKDDFLFEQSYLCDTICYTSEKDYKQDVGVEGDFNTFMKYRNKVQYSNIDNKEGIWTINSDTLILMTTYGKEILRIKILEATKYILKLQKNNYTVTLHKKSSRK